ncbi:MAG: DUF417 family protein [Flavobacteriales bacterium]
MRDLGVNISRAGVGIVLLAIGLYKFTEHGAGDIYVHVSNSPILSWLYKLGDKQFVSNMIGVMEILIALLIFFGFKNQKAALMGGILGTVTFIITLSFFITSPSADIYETVEWCPTPNGFILKDIVFLGVCLQLAIENW